MTRRLPVFVLACGMLAACGPSPDDDALAICERVPAGRAAITALEENVTRTADFDAVSGHLMEVYDITAFLQDWSYVATDDLNGPVRTDARAALSSTGMYSDGTNPVTGAELKENLRAAQRTWDRLERSCVDLTA